MDSKLGRPKTIITGTAGLYILTGGLYLLESNEYIHEPIKLLGNTSIQITQETLSPFGDIQIYGVKNSNSYSTGSNIEKYLHGE